MNTKTIMMSSLGFFAGITMVAVSQNVNFSEKTSRGAVTELFASGNIEGREVINTGATFIEEESMLSEIIPLSEESGDLAAQIGRYQMQSLGNSPNFAVLDTATGVVRGYYPQTNEVVLYSPAVPNHAVKRPLRVHDAFEAVR